MPFNWERHTTCSGGGEQKHEKHWLQMSLWASSSRLHRLRQWTRWTLHRTGSVQGCKLNPSEMQKRWARRSTRWNQDCQEKYHLRYADDTTLMAESEEELKSLIMKVKVESEKVGLKLSIQKTKIMASGPITSWEIDGKTVGKVSDFILGGSKITADGDCSHEIKRCLLLGGEVMTNLDSIFKSRDITLPTKFHLVKATVFQ